jgi:FkbH-like protein
VQRLALDLRQRGIVLAVASKNTDEVAREPFRTHPEMLLKLEHIAVFQANWNDKATNIQAIAEELSLGLDAMVFLDDNPAERGLVRKLLPQVSVPELPEEPAYFARTWRRRATSRPSLLPRKTSNVPVSIKTTPSEPFCKRRSAAWTRTLHHWI